MLSGGGGGGGVGKDGGGGGKTTGGGAVTTGGGAGEGELTVSAGGDGDAKSNAFIMGSTLISGKIVFTVFEEDADDDED